VVLHIIVLHYCYLRVVTHLRGAIQCDDAVVVGGYIDHFVPIRYVAFTYLYHFTTPFCYYLVVDLILIPLDDCVDAAVCSAYICLYVTVLNIILKPHYP